MEQFWEVFAECGFAACEGEDEDAYVAEFVDGLLPLLGGEFGCFVWSAGVAVDAVVLAAESQRHIHPKRRRILMCKRFLFLDFKIGDGVDFLGLRQCAYGEDEFFVICFCLFRV